MAEWKSALQLASLGLPGLPTSKRAIIHKADRETWERRDRTGRGGGYEYSVRSLPKEAQVEFAKRQISNVHVSPQLPAYRVEPDLKKWQSDTLEARLAILNEINKSARVVGFQKAEAAFADMAKTKSLPDHLQILVVKANARGGKCGKRTVSAVTLRRWRTDLSKGGMKALCPEESRRAKKSPPDWLPHFLTFYQIGSKPSIAAAYDLFRRNLPSGAQLPNLRTIHRELRKISAVDLNRGRMGPRELKALQTYVARDVSELWPGAVYVSDGHCFDAEVAHPRHGRPFRPEITGIIDAYSRKLVGWSAALSENTFGVMDAARHAFETSGLCDIWYVDNGSGFNNAAFDAELTGFLSRLSITKENSLPYNSQARGIIERLHQSLWIRAAKMLPTYLGADMDREAKQKAFKLTRQDIKQIGASPLLMEWRDFLIFSQEQMDDYNDRPHTALRKIRDPETGTRRHMTPNEAWLEGCERRVAPERLTEFESLDLSRPQERRTTRRGLVSVFGNSYFSEELEPWFGEEVLVGYDIHDWSKVWVRALDQRPICIAAFEGNKASFFPVSVAERANQRRAQGRLKRLGDKVDEVLAERDGVELIEQQITPQFDSAELLAASDKVELLITPQDEPSPAVSASGRPILSTDIDFARWLLANPSEVTQNDKALLREHMRSNAFRMQLDCAGLSQADLRQIALKESA